MHWPLRLSTNCLSPCAQCRSKAAGLLGCLAIVIGLMLVWVAKTLGA